MMSDCVRAAELSRLKVMRNERHGEDIMSKLRFCNCPVSVFVRSMYLLSCDGRARAVVCYLHALSRAIALSFERQPDGCASR